MWISWYGGNINNVVRFGININDGHECDNGHIDDDCYIDLIYVSINVIII